MRHSVPLVPIALGFPGPLVGLYILVYIIKKTHLLVCLFLFNQRFPIPARIASLRSPMHA